MPPAAEDAAQGETAAPVAAPVTRVERVAAAIAVLAAIAVAYANALGASFQFDDWDVIVRDPRVQSLPAWWASMPGIRPLLKASYALNHASGLGVVGFHAVNVILHAGVALLVLALARRLAVRAGVDGAPPTRLALWTALVFALHPVQTEAVTYASGRSACLSTGLALASILFWLRGERGEARADPCSGALAAARRARGASPVFMLLALAVKESAVVVPAVLMLWIATDPSRPFRPAEALRATALHWASLGSALVAALALPAYRALLSTSLATRAPGENLAAQTHGVAWLFGQLVRFDRLNADPALPAVTTWDAASGLLALAFVGVLVVAWIARRNTPIAAFAILWTAIWLAPTNSLVARLDLVNDRQWYGALVGPALLAGLGIEALARRLAARTGIASPAAIAVALALVLVATLGIATHRRNRVYRDEVVFWRDVIAKSPGNARAFNNLGIALAERCDREGAVGAWRRALALDPGYVRAAVNLRLALEEGPATSRCGARRP